MVRRVYQRAALFRNGTCGEAACTYVMVLTPMILSIIFSTEVDFGVGFGNHHQLVMHLWSKVASERLGNTGLSSVKTRSDKYKSMLASARVILAFAAFYKIFDICRDDI